MVPEVVRAVGAQGVESRSIGDVGSFDPSRPHPKWCAGKIGLHRKAPCTFRVIVVIVGIWPQKHRMPNLVAEGRQPNRRTIPQVGHEALADPHALRGRVSPAAAATVRPEVGGPTIRDHVPRVDQRQASELTLHGVARQIDIVVDVLVDLFVEHVRGVIVPGLDVRVVGRDIARRGVVANHHMLHAGQSLGDLLAPALHRAVPGPSIRLTRVEGIVDLLRRDGEGTIREVNQHHQAGDGAGGRVVSAHRRVRDRHAHRAIRSHPGGHGATVRVESTSIGHAPRRSHDARLTDVRHHQKLGQQPLVVESLVGDTSRHQSPVHQAAVADAS